MIKWLMVWLFPATIIVLSSCDPKLANGLRKKDLYKDIEMITTMGTLVIRLSDSTPCTGTISWCW